jgi:hypothetical protein
MLSVNIKKMNSKTYNIILVSIFAIMIYTCSTVRNDKPCDQCTQYTQQIDSLKKKIKIDSITLNQVNKDYYELWEENQIFSSMLSEIENEPGGHEILKKLWDKETKKNGI